MLQIVRCLALQLHTFNFFLLRVANIVLGLSQIFKIVNNIRKKKLILYLMETFSVSHYSAQIKNYKQCSSFNYTLKTYDIEFNRVDID